MSEGSGSSVYDKFINLRAAIIRAVALAWQDEEYKKELLEDPEAAMEKELDYKYPFQDLTLHVAEETTEKEAEEYRPEIAGGWVGPENTLTLYLPPAPKDEDQQPFALATYNAHHLTLLGQK